jgi:hypothetical protein
MQLQFAHLEWSCVTMSQQVSNQSSIFVDLFRSFAIRDARSLNYSSVAAHVVDNSHEAIIEHREAMSEDGVQCGRAWSKQWGVGRRHAETIYDRRERRSGAPTASNNSYRQSALT